MRATWIFGFLAIAACEATTPQSTLPCPDDPDPVVDTGPTTPPAPTGEELKTEVLFALAPATELRVRDAFVSETVDAIEAAANYPKEQVALLGDLDDELSRMDAAAVDLEAGLVATGRQRAGGRRFDVGPATAAVRELRDEIQIFRESIADQLSESQVDISAVIAAFEQVETVASSVQKTTDDTASNVISKV